MTEKQSTVGNALEAIGFQLKPSKVKGGPTEYPITDEVIDELTENKGKSLVVASDASVSIE